VPEQPTISMDRPIGTLKANIENNIGNANIPRVNLSI
jgi:hypothetical protein